MPIKWVYINNVDAFKKNTLTYLNCFNTYNAFTINNKYLEVAQTIFANQYQKNLYADQYYSFIQNTNKTLDVQDLYQSIDNNVYTSLSIYDIESFSKEIKDLYTASEEIFGVPSTKYLFDISNIHSLIKNNAYIYLSEGNNAKVLYKELPLHIDLIFFKNIYRSLFVDEHNLFAEINKKYIYALFEHDFANKDWHVMTLYNRIDSIQKAKKALEIVLNTVFFEKNANKMYLNQNQNFITKIHKDIYITNTYTSVDKTVKHINNGIALSNLQKSNHLLNKTFDTLFSEKYFKSLFIQNTAGFLYKEYKDTSIDTDYVSDIFKEYFNINNQQSVISINKINKPMFTSKIIEHVMKK